MLFTCQLVKKNPDLTGLKEFTHFGGDEYDYLSIHVNNCQIAQRIGAG